MCTSITFVIYNRFKQGLPLQNLRHFCLSNSCVAALHLLSPLARLCERRKDLLDLVSLSCQYKASQPQVLVSISSCHYTSQHENPLSLNILEQLLSTQEPSLSIIQKYFSYPSLALNNYLTTSLYLLLLTFRIQTQSVTRFYNRDI